MAKNNINGVRLGESIFYGRVVDVPVVPKNESVRMTGVIASMFVIAGMFMIVRMFMRGAAWAVLGLLLKAAGKRIVFRVPVDGDGGVLDSELSPEYLFRL